MFINEALCGDDEGFSDALKARIAKMEMLAPGDFAAVKRQYVLFDEKPDPVQFIEQLEKEHGVKADVKFSKPIGFVH